MPEVDIVSPLAVVATTVMKGPEGIHVPESVKVIAIQVPQKYLNCQGFLIVDCGCVTCTWKSMNLDESVASTKSENDNVAKFYSRDPSSANIYHISRIGS